MLDVLLKSKFYNKCKPDIKLTRTRIEMIMKKRKAMQKYLRNDVADLLKNGLDINAYGRAEGLVVEQIRTSCYEILETYCIHIYSHISTMDKQNECPEECREAVSSLMFAAARFADLPELRDMRKLFSEKYGNFLDCYVNKEFVEKLTLGHPSKDMKLRLLQEVAEEYELEWDSKALENKLYNEDFTKEMNDSVNPDNGFKLKKTSYKYYEQKEAIETDEKIPEDVKDIEVDIIKKRNEQASVINLDKEEEEDEEKPGHNYSLIPPPYTKTSLRDNNEEVGPTESADPEKKIPKSVRRRNLKPQLSPEVVPESEDIITDKEKAALGQRILRFFDRGGEDEEETKMDKLLHYYSRKKGSRERGKSVIEPTNDESISPNGSKKHKEVQTRASSLPPEMNSPRDFSPKRHNRASSFQPKVHPKLPDYDDFVARLAAYRGK